MKRRTLAIMWVGLALGLLLVGCGSAPTPTPVPTVAAPGKVVKATGKIIAEGRVVPVRGVALSFPTSGLVAQVPVSVGSNVKAGDVIAQLDTKQLELQLAQAEANLAAAQAKLNQLKNSPKPEDLAAAQQNVKSAQAAYDALLKPSANELAALKADVDKAKAAVEQAQAAYDRIGGDSNPNANMSAERARLQAAFTDLQRAQALYNAKANPSDADVQKALAAIQTAKEQLAKLQPAAEEIAAAEANVNAASAARDLVAEQIKKAKLTAPFAGTVTSLEVKVGEYVAPGNTVARLADTSAWQIETTDLTEINIVNVKQGDPVTITFDAIPDLDLTGKVTNIKGFGENRQGDIVYTVVVTPDKMDPRLRWNMTAKVSISQ